MIFATGYQVLQEKAIYFFISNILLEMSTVDFETMFCQVGQIMDFFILMYKVRRRNSGFAFLRRASQIEPDQVIYLILSKLKV